MHPWRLGRVVPAREEQQLVQLFPRFTQDTRLLRLTTPLGPDKLLAECLRGEESLSRGYCLELSVLSTDAHIALKSLLGQPVLLELLTMVTTLPGMSLRRFHGHVTRARLLGANGGFARYCLTIEPWSAFMAFGRDSRIFQNKTVFDILDAVFAGWQGLGKLVPAWRYDLVERGAHPVRSLTCQYQESNLAFAERLMSEEGLFYYFEHSAAADSGDLGSHTLVIANHNGSFKPNAQAEVRFTQPGAVMREDSIDRWRIMSRQVAGETAISSWDYRSRGTLPVSADSGAANQGNRPQLRSRDTPGAYAYPTRAQGQRIADNQLQALSVAAQTHVGAGTVRSFAPGITFSLRGQPQLDQAGDDDGRSFAILRVLHLAHNNLGAELTSTITQALGKARSTQRSPKTPASARCTATASTPSKAACPTAAATSTATASCCTRGRPRSDSKPPSSSARPAPWCIPTATTASRSSSTGSATLATAT
jgi:type VI secretion system secreted protein VgrG